jgi:hypothetical protein
MLVVLEAHFVAAAVWQEVAHQLSYPRSQSLNQLTEQVRGVCWSQALPH